VSLIAAETVGVLALPAKTVVTEAKITRALNISNSNDQKKTDKQVISTDLMTRKSFEKVVV
jgi:hypothetical protein